MTGDIVAFSREELAQLDKVDDLIKRVETTGNLHLAWNYIGGLRRGGELAARGIAKTLYELKERWSIFPTDDDFIDVAQASTGLSRQTIEKGIDYWENVLLPHPELMHLPVGAYHLIAPAARHGDLDDEDWEALETATNINDVRDIIKSKRGNRTSAEHALTILMERDGSLNARRGSGGWVPFGFFNLDMEDEVAVTAIDRIVKAAGIQKR